MDDVVKTAESPVVNDPWRAFQPGRWQSEIDVRGFIAANVNPYEGDSSFQSPMSARTKAVWAALQPYFLEEMKKGVLDADPANPSALLSHGAGYIDREKRIAHICFCVSGRFVPTVFPAFQAARPRTAAS